MKRVFLFVAVNLAVMFLLMLVVNVILSLAGPDVRESMYHGGIDMFSLGVFSLVFGMGGAFISAYKNRKLRISGWQCAIGQSECISCAIGAGIS